MEKTVEAYLRNRVKAAGGLALKLVCPGWTGVPDRLILLPGARVYFAETKDLGKDPEAEAALCAWAVSGFGLRRLLCRNSKPAVDAMMAAISGEGMT